MKSTEELLGSLQVEVAGMKTAQAVTMSRLDSIHETLGVIRDRPPPGVPVWLIVLMSAPPMITSLALLLLIAVNSLAR